jgi:hypothetical protein
MLEKPKKDKKKTLSYWKKKVLGPGEVFSQFIRLRDCLKTTGGLENGFCYTCGRLYPFKSLQAGHWIPGRGGGNVLDERGCHAQCLTEESLIRMSDGSTVSIRDLVVGDTLSAFDENLFQSCVAMVESTKSFLPEEMYEVEMEDGSKFFATPDHMVLANGKWVQIQDMLHDCSAYDILEK